MHPKNRCVGAALDAPYDSSGWWGIETLPANPLDLEQLLENFFRLAPLRVVVVNVLDQGGVPFCSVHAAQETRPGRGVAGKRLVRDLEVGLDAFENGRQLID